MALVAIPVVFCATRFPPRIVRLATATAIGLLLVATFGAHPAASIADPAGVAISVAVIIGISAAVHALNRSELQVRDTAILDPLTGLLNRQGLERRLDELAEQARIANAPISLLICDLDHFKQINDSFGHATGDAVLRDVAVELRSHMRSFDLAYRIGGEEFLIVLPGATLPQARVLAERLCEATRSCRPQGIELTMSVGVCTCQGARASYDHLFNAADRALYRAKAEGRDRVCSAPPRATDATSGPAQAQAQPPAQPAAAPATATAS